MKQFLLSLLLAALLFNCKAQNWQAINTDSIVYYTDFRGYFYGNVADSSIVGSNSTKYEMHKTISRMLYCYSEQYGQPDYGYDTNITSWIGEEVEHFNNGDIYFYPRPNDTIKFKAGAQLGQSWVLYSTDTGHLQAEVIAIDTASVFGGIDTVKTLLITAINTTDSSLMRWDSVQLPLSKNHGLLKIPRMVSFPYGTQVLDRSIKKVLTYGDVYNYEVGDYFQKKKVHYSYPDTTVTLEYFRVLVKVYADGGETVTYTMHHEEQDSVRGNTSLVVDTVNKTYYRLSEPIVSASTGLPAMVDASTFANPVMYVYDGPDQGLQGRRVTKESFIVAVEQTNDSCWNWNGTWDAERGDLYYYECLGRSYSAHVFSGIYEEEFVCYSVCGETYGQKLVLGVDDLQSLGVSMYPNPATDQLNLINGSTTDFEVQLMDLQGKMIQQMNLTVGQRKSWPVNDLPTGLYVVRFITGSKSYYQKVIITQ